MGRAWIVVAVLAAGGCRWHFDELPGAGSGGAPDARPGDPLVAPRALAISATGACAVLADGTLWCWGDNTRGGLGVPASTIVPPTQVGAATDWVEVSLAADHGCGRTASGALWCWGAALSGLIPTGDTTLQPAPVPIGTDLDWTGVAVNAHGGCGVRGGGLYCWGNNAYGLVGDGTDMTQRSPVPIAAGTTFTAVTTSASHACALDDAARLWCWGLGSSGQLGSGQLITANPLPLSIGTDTWRHISAGADVTCGVRTDGTLWVWGAYMSATPQQVGAQAGFTEAACGSDDGQAHHVCGIRGGELWCAGVDNKGAVGTGGDVSVPLATPIQVEPGRVFTRVVAAPSTTCAVRDDQLVCTGLGDLGQLGDGVERAPIVPRPLAGTYAELTPGLDFVVARATDGALRGWGANDNTQLSGAPFRYTRAPVPVTPAAWPRVAASFNGALALAVDGSLWAWGAQFYAQGAASSYPPPPRQVGTATWTDIEGGAWHWCGVQADGSLWCWGPNDAGQLGTGDLVPAAAPRQVGTPAQTYVAVAAGYERSCGIRTTGTLWCWGSNGGALGDGTLLPRQAPTQVGTQATWTAVSMGINRTCGLQAGGALWCWGTEPGDGAVGPQLAPVRIGAATWSQIAVGDTHACGRQVDGTLWCWGDNTSGQLGDGTRLPRLAPVQIGTSARWTEVRVSRDFTCALDDVGVAACWGSNHDGQLGNGLAWVTAFQPVVR